MNIVCIPGLGANSLVFTPQKQHFGQRLYVPNFIEPLKQESLQDYCARWASDMRNTLSEPYILVGMSLGGMMAQELSQHLAPKAIVLLGSLQHRMPNQFGHQLAEKVGQWLPNNLIKTIKNYSPHWIAQFEGLSAEHKALITTMIQQNSIDFYKWQGCAAARWIKNGFQGEYPCPLYRAHGGKDTVVFLDKKLEAHDLYLPKARHLINLTHADQINAFIEQCMDRVIT